jgi:hypothetical protein
MLEVLLLGHFTCITFQDMYLHMEGWEGNVPSVPT